MGGWRLLLLLLCIAAFAGGAAGEACGEFTGPLCGPEWLNCTSVSAITLSASSVTTLDCLANVTSVEGRAEIVSCPQLESVDGLAAGLVSVGGALVLIDNDALPAVRLPDLVSATSLVLRRNDGLANVSAPALAALDPGGLALEDLPLLDSVRLDALERVVSSVTVTRCDLLVAFELPRLAGNITTLLMSENAALRFFNLSGVTHSVAGFDGVHIVDNERLVGFDLGGLVGVERNLLIRGNAALETLDGLASLRRVGNQLTLEDLVSLTSVAALAAMDTPVVLLRVAGCPALNSIAAMRGAFGADMGSVTIISTGLQSLEGLEALRRVGGGVTINSNTEVRNLDALEGLESVGGALVLSLNGLVDIEGLRHVEELGSLAIMSESGLSSLAGLRSLTTVSSILLSDCYALTTVEGLDMLTAVGGDLTLSSCLSLESLDGLRSLRSVSGDFRLLTLRALGSAALPALETVGLRFQVSGCTTLESLAGLERLRLVSGVVSITGNTALRTLDGLAGLERVSFGIDLSGNAALETACLCSLEQVEHLIDASDSPMLDCPSVRTLLDPLSTILSRSADCQPDDGAVPFRLRAVRAPESVLVGPTRNGTVLLEPAGGAGSENITVVPGVGAGGGTSPVLFVPSSVSWPPAGPREIAVTTNPAYEGIGGATVTWDVVRGPGAPRYCQVCADSTAATLQGEVVPAVSSPSSSSSSSSSAAAVPVDASALSAVVTYSLNAPVPDGLSLVATPSLSCGNAGCGGLSLGAGGAPVSWEAGEAGNRNVTVGWSGAQPVPGGDLFPANLSLNLSGTASLPADGGSGTPLFLSRAPVRVALPAAELQTPEIVVLPGGAGGAAEVRVGLNGPVPAGQALTVTASFGEGGEPGVTVDPPNVTWAAGEGGSGGGRAFVVSWDPADGSTARVAGLSFTAGGSAATLFAAPAGAARVVLRGTVSVEGVPAAVFLGEPSGAVAVTVTPPPAEPEDLAVALVGDDPLLRSEESGGGLQLRWTGTSEADAERVTVRISLAGPAAAELYVAAAPEAGGGPWEVSAYGARVLDVVSRALDASRELVLSVAAPANGTALDGLYAAVGLPDEGAPAPAGELDGLQSWDSLTAATAPGQALPRPGAWVPCGPPLELGPRGVAVDGTQGTLFEYGAASCSLPAGLVGAGWRVVLLHGGGGGGGGPVVAGAVSPPAATASAPRLTVRAGTLRLSRDGAGSSDVVALTTSAQDVFFDVLGAGSVAGIVRVEIGDGSAGESSWAPCPVTELVPGGGLLGFADRLGCTAPELVSAAGALVFRVTVAGAAVVGVDRLSYLLAPAVTTVRGCAGDVDSGVTAAVGCRTTGGERVTVRGERLGGESIDGSTAETLVSVNGAACTAVLALNRTTLTCDLPPGSGVDQDVTVTTNGRALLRSPQARLVSYAAPVVRSVTAGGGACSEADSTATQLRGCTLDGPFDLTVSGSHFGVASAPRVLVGVTECAGVAVERVDDVADTQRLVCRLAAEGRSLADQPVLVLQAGGGVSDTPSGSSAASVSFEECGCGTKTNETSGSCVPCTRNTYQPDSGQSDCRACPSGQYLRGGDGSACSGGERCATCPDGTDCAPRSPAAARENWWLYEEEGSAAALSSVRSLRCVAGRCLAAARCLPPGAAAQAELEASESVTVSCCAEGREPAAGNPMCGRCLPGRSEWGGECVECTSVSAGLVVGFLLLGLALVIGLERLTRDSSGATVKITVAFGQVLYTFFAADDASPVAGGALLSFSPLDLSGTCVAPMSDLTKAALPVVQVLLALALLAALAAANAAHWALCGRAAGVKFKRSPFLRVLLALLVFAYVPTLRAALLLSLCESVGGRDLLRAYPTVECGTGAHAAWAVVCWCLAGALLLGIGLFVALYGQRRYRLFAAAAAADATDAGAGAQLLKLRKSIEERFGFLFLSYRGRRPGAGATRPRGACVEAAAASWEAAVLLRSTAFVVAAAVVDDRQSRFSVMALLALFSLLVHVRVRPYRQARENTLETMSLTAIAAIGSLNATAWGEGAAVRELSAALFYGLVAVACAWGLAASCRKGRLSSARKAILSASSSRRFHYAAAPAPRQEAPSLAARAVAELSRAFCWYRPGPGGGGQVPGGLRRGDGKASSAAAAGSSASSLVVMEMDERAPAGGSDRGNDVDSSSSSTRTDASGRVWTRVPVWTCAETGESQWEEPAAAADQS